MKFPSDECHCTLLMMSQHWFEGNGLVPIYPIRRTNVDLYLDHHMVSLGHSGLKGKHG